MKIDEKLRQRLGEAAEKHGGVVEFSRHCGVDAGNISRYLNGRVRSISDDNWSKLERFLEPPPPRDPEQIRRSFAPRTAYATVVRNTPELRGLIERAMREHGLHSSADLTRFIGYDQPSTLERLFAGELHWFPDLLSAVFDALEIDRDSTPLTRSEKELLSPPGLFRNGALLVRPLPVVDWANAASELESYASDSAVMKHWDVENTDTVPVPVGGRSDMRAFRVNGVSMEPIIIDNDVLLVEPANNLEEIPNNKIVVAKFSDETRFPERVVCKRFHRQSGGLLLLTSDNPAGKIISANSSDFAWIGVVVRKISEL